MSKANLNHQAMLSPDQEKLLLCAWQQDKCIKSRNKLVLAFQPLIKRLSFLEFKRSGLPSQDVISYCQLLVIDAINKFDRERGVRLSGYINAIIKNELYKYRFSNTSAFSRSYNPHSARAYIHMGRESQKFHAHNPNSGNIECNIHLASLFKVSLRLIELLQASNIAPYSINSLFDSDDKKLSIEIPCQVDFDTPIDDSRLRDRLAIAIAKLPDRHKQVIQERFFTEGNELKAFNTITLFNKKDGKPISRQRVQQLEVAAIAKLKKVLMNG